LPFATSGQEMEHAYSCKPQPARDRKYSMVRFLLSERDYVTFGSSLSHIRLSSVVRNVRAPYSGVEAFTHTRLLQCSRWKFLHRCVPIAIVWHPCKILRWSSRGNPSTGCVKRKTGSKIERLGLGTCRKLYLTNGTRYGLG